MMHKVLVRTENAVKAIIELWNSQFVFHNMYVSDFEKFPAVLVYGFEPYKESKRHDLKANWCICYEDDFVDETEKHDNIYDE